MALSPLATTADLQTRAAQGFDQAVTAQAEALLLDASAAVRNYTGQTFTRVVGDVVTLRVSRGRVILPQRPADKPTQIAYADGSGVIAAAAWWWGGLEQVDLCPPAYIANGPSFWRNRIPEAVVVTYSHGYTEIPSDVVGVVCQMVLRVVMGVGSSPGLKSEAIDDYQYALGGSLVSGTVALVPEERELLDRYRRRTGSVVLR